MNTVKGHERPWNHIFIHSTNTWLIFSMISCSTYQIYRGHEVPEGVKSWPCLCEIDLNFTWLRGSWEKNDSSRKLTNDNIKIFGDLRTRTWVLSVAINSRPSPCSCKILGPTRRPGLKKVGLFDQNSDICWIEFPDTILNLFNLIEQKTLFTQNQIWADFKDLYPFVQIAPDKTGQKFNSSILHKLHMWYVRSSYRSLNFRWSLPHRCTCYDWTTICYGGNISK